MPGSAQPMCLLSASVCGTQSAFLLQVFSTADFAPLVSQMQASQANGTGEVAVL